MTTEDESEQITQPLTVYTGPRWLADLKVNFGEWLEKRRGTDSNPGTYLGFATVADLKVRLGVWLEKRRRD
jgi:hypothetical protein